jgi:hypothetical protein
VPRNEQGGKRIAAMLPSTHIIIPSFLIEVEGGGGLTSSFFASAVEDGEIGLTSTSFTSFTSVTSGGGARARYFDFRRTLVFIFFFYL